MRRARRALDNLDDDIRDHIERETRDNIDRGMSPEEAYRQAMVRFGNVTLVKADTRAVWGWHRLEQLAQDVQFAVRVLRRRPAYALLSILTLALGIGGTAAVFGVARGVLIDPLPYAHEHEVGMFWMKTDWTHEEFLYLRGQFPGFREVALYRSRDSILRAGDGASRIVANVTSSHELLDVLGVTPLLGRGFRQGDDVPGAEPVALLSFGLWQELGGTPAIVGTRVRLDGSERTVIGVMPRGFWFPNPSVRIWTPWPLRSDSRSWNSTLIGRVLPDKDVRAMDVSASQVAAMLEGRFVYSPQRDKTKDRHITPLRDDILGPMRPAVVATFVATVLILLTGCANVAALVLGQVDARSAEFAVRSALGANRSRLAQQLIVEVLMLAAIAGAVGALLAWASFPIVTSALPLGAWADSAVPDWRVVASASAVAVAAALLVSMVPMISLYRTDLRSVLNRARTGGIAGRGGRLENTLVIVQVALAVVVGAGAAILARSVSNLYAVEPGVRIDGVAVIDLMLSGGGSTARREQSLAEVATSLEQLPGVESVGRVQQLPIRGGGYRAELRVDERPGDADATEYRIVAPGYFESIGMEILSGRSIAKTDQKDSERVVVINEAFAQRYFPGADPIGKLIGGDNPKRSRIVGVVSSAAEGRLTDAVQPVRYVPTQQSQWVDDAQTMVIRMKAGVGEAAVLESARRAIAIVAPAIAIQETTTMRRVLDTAVGPARQVVLLLSLLAGLALALGAVGVYGVVTHFASRRKRDWAIRVAIGLPGSRVVAQVLGHGALLVLAGIAIGMAGAAVFTRWLSTFLYGVSTMDPVAFVAAGASLLVVGSAAAFVPALRAGTADPLEALREQ